MAQGYECILQISNQLKLNVGNGVHVMKTLTKTSVNMAHLLRSLSKEGFMMAEMRIVHLGYMHLEYSGFLLLISGHRFCFLNSVDFYFF